MRRFQIWFILVAATFAGLAGGGQARGEFLIESLDNDFPAEIAAAKDEGKKLVIFFHQLGCPYCDKMRKRVLPDPKVVEYYGQHYVMVESNIKGNLDVVSPDGEPMKETELGRKYRVRATPVYVFFDDAGKKALQLTGFLDADLFVRAGQYVVEGMHQKNVSFYRYLKGETQ